MVSARWMVIVFLMVFSQWATAATNLGVVLVNNPTTFTLSRQDISRNFVDNFYFTLTTQSQATFSFASEFADCRRGCGNPVVISTLRDSVGGNLAMGSGSIILSSGTYSFGVKGTGIGSGNQGTYSGNIFVSPVPEPHDILLMIIGLLMVTMAVAYRRSMNQ